MFAAAAAALAISMLSSTAAFAAGWEKVSGNWFYRQEDGTVVKDAWVQDEAGESYWMRNDGVMATLQWVGYDNAWYYVGENGTIMKNQLLELNNHDLYWLHEDGKMAANEWVDVEGKWYYFQDNGLALKKGWKQIDGDWYYFLNSGVMAADALVPGGYRVGADGRWIQ